MCCGLNYYKPHLLRSKVIIEVATSLTVGKEDLALYEANGKEGIVSVMHRVYEVLNNISFFTIQIFNFYIKFFTIIYYNLLLFTIFSL